jgi:RNA polymerase sigma-70 factor (ECF subfamily)
MPADASFDAVIGRLRAGDPGAAVEVFDRFAGRLIALARSRLGARLRAKVDPEDILQSVYKSFLRRYAGGGQELTVAGWDDLWGLLAVITLRKCGHKVARFLAACRDVRREVPAPPPDGAADGWEVIARDPTPSEAAILAETVEGLLRGLEGRDRDIVTLALQGHTTAEISAQLRRPPRAVYRVLDQVRKRLRRLGGSSA